MPLNNLIKKIEALEKFDVQKETIEIINEYGWYITGLLRLQLQVGKDSNDEPLKIFGRDYYAEKTVFDKEHGNYPPLGKITEYVTYFKTGQFYFGLHTHAEGRVFSTQSDVSYFEKIIEMAGDSIIKLNKEHLMQFTQEILKPQLQERWRMKSG